MKIAVLGIGGVGGIVGGALAKSHAETYFCVREKIWTPFAATG